MLKSQSFQNVGSLIALPADEVARSEQFRTNYKVLKSAHSELQADHVKLEEEMRRELNKAESIQSQLKSIVSQLRDENAQLKSSYKSLQEEVGPSYHERLRNDISDQIVRPLQQHNAKLETELSTTRQELLSQRRDYMFLKSEYEHVLSDHNRLIKDMRTQSEVQIECLNREKEELKARIRELTSSNSDLEQIKALQRDNYSLTRRVKDLLNELEEIESNRVGSELSGQRARSSFEKEISELKTLLQIINGEKENLRQLIDNSHSELNDVRQQLTQSNKTVHQLQQDLIIVRNEKEELEHKLKVERDSIQLEANKRIQILENSLDKQTSLSQQQLVEIERLSQSNKEVKSQLSETKVNIARSVEMAKAENLDKIQRLETEKLDLERRLGKAEDRVNRGGESPVSNKLASAEQARDEIQIKAAQLKDQLIEAQASVKQLSLENESLENLNEEMKKEVSSIKKSERQVIGLNQQLQAELKSTASQIQDLREKSLKSEGNAGSQVINLKAQLEEERRNSQSRIDTLQSRLAESVANVDRISRECGDLRSRSEGIIRKLKVKLKAARNENEELSRRVPPEELRSLKLKLDSVFRKQRQFGSILQGCDTHLQQIAGHEFRYLSPSPQPAVWSLPVPRGCSGEAGVLVVEKEAEEKPERKRPPPPVSSTDDSISEEA